MKEIDNAPHQKQYVTVTGLTANGQASSNNRGETEGQRSTLNKINDGDNGIRVVFSTESMRYIMRGHYATYGYEVNRHVVFDENAKAMYAFHDIERSEDGVWIDDEVHGYMATKSGTQGKKKKDRGSDEDAQQEAAANDNAAGDEKGKSGDCNKRTGALYCSRAVSLRRWAGNVLFSAARTNTMNPYSVPYLQEIHEGPYQFTMRVDIASLDTPGFAPVVLRAMTELGLVAGNHAHDMHDMAADSIVIRVTDDHCPRIQNCFGGCQNDDAPPTITRLIDLIERGDVDATEIIVGGTIAKTPDAAKLKSLGVRIFAGVKMAYMEALKELPPVAPPNANKAAARAAPVRDVFPATEGNGKPHERAKAGKGAAKTHRK
jgi:CRISPR-associated protein Cst2